MGDVREKHLKTTYEKPELVETRFSMIGIFTASGDPNAGEWDTEEETESEG